MLLKVASVLNITTEIQAHCLIPSSSKMKISIRLGLIMAPACEKNKSSCRSRKNDSVFSSVSSSVIVTLKHSLRGPAVGDPGLLGNTKEVDRNAVN